MRSQLQQILKTGRVELRYWSRSCPTSTVPGMNWNLEIADFLEAREHAAMDGEFEAVVPPPPNRVHSRELLTAVGAKPTCANLQRLRKLMIKLGWMPSPNLSICGRQGKGYMR
jgi:hypothetical protein